MVPELTEERHNEWDLQLPYAGLVHQLSPPIKEHSLPDLDNTVKTLFYWAMDLDIPHGPRLALLTILRHIDWKEGDHCIAGIQTLARESQFSKKTLKGHLKYLVDAKLISRFRHIGRTTETRLGTVGVETTPMVGVETTPMVGVEPTPETNSSSTNPINQLGTGLVDAKRVDDSEPEPNGVTDGGLNSFSLEEERTGTGAEQGQQPTPEPSKPTDPTVSAPPPPALEGARAFVDGVLSEIPTDSEIERLGKHCWRKWSKHWGGGWAAAWSTWTKDTAGRKKFKADSPMHLAQVRLPQPMEPNVEDQAARESTAAWMDQRMTEGPQRRIDVKCAACGLLRQLRPGETHCYLCRKELRGGVDSKTLVAVSIPLPDAMGKATRYTVGIGSVSIESKPNRLID